MIILYIGFRLFFASGLDITGYYRSAYSMNFT